MTDTREQISQLLREASETHHRVFRIVDGADDDWASWYAWWLINLSELPALLETTPVRSELIYLLVDLDKLYTAEQPGEPWESYYARRILDHFHPVPPDPCESFRSDQAGDTECIPAASRPARPGPHRRANYRPWKRGSRLSTKA